MARCASRSFALFRASCEGVKVETLRVPGGAVESVSPLSPLHSSGTYGSFLTLPLGSLGRLRGCLARRVFLHGHVGVDGRWDWC